DGVQVDRLRRRAQARARCGAHGTQPALHQRVEVRIGAEGIEQCGAVRDQLRYFLIQSADRKCGIEAKQLLRRFRTIAMALPDLALLVPVATEKYRTPSVAVRDQRKHAFRLGKAAEIEKMAVEAERILAVAIAHAFGCGRLDRNAA